MDRGDTLSESVTAARTHLDDLQAEIEAGDRYAGRIQTDAGSIDNRVARHLRYAARCGELVRCATDLRASIAQQRGILRDLRRELDTVRRELKRRK